eukprot:1985905-Prymnesium_polylepis.1
MSILLPSFGVCCPSQELTLETFPDSYVTIEGEPVPSWDEGRAQADYAKASPPPSNKSHRPTRISGAVSGCLGPMSDARGHRRTFETLRCELMAVCARDRLWLTMRCSSDATSSQDPSRHAMRAPPPRRACARRATPTRTASAGGQGPPQRAPLPTPR